MATCTLFSVTDSDLESPTDMTLPTVSTSGDRTSKLGSYVQPHTADLGLAWQHLHRALGAYPEGHPLGFLGGGGQPFAALDDGTRSSGRYFAPPTVIKLLAAVAKINDDYMMKNIAKMQIVEVSVSDLLRLLARVRIFLAEAVEGDRGVIVHKLS